MIPTVHSLIHLLQNLRELRTIEVQHGSTARAQNLELFDRGAHNNAAAAEARLVVESDRTGQEGDTAQKIRAGGVEGSALEG